MTAYECEKHGPYGPARFCCACTREAVEAERDRYRDALIRCATLAGADVSDGPPTWPPADVWAVQEVEQLRRDYDEACGE